MRHRPSQAGRAYSDHGRGADDCVVMCPLHGIVYDVQTGAARNGTAPVAVYRVRSEDGVITATLPTR